MMLYMAWVISRAHGASQVLMLRCSTKTIENSYASHLDTGSWRGGAGERQGAGLNTDVVICLRCQQREPRTLRPSVQTTRRPSKHCRHCFVSELISNMSQPPLWKNPKHMGLQDKGCVYLAQVDYDRIYLRDDDGNHFEAQR